jgi:uncharacterized protein
LEPLVVVDTDGGCLLSIKVIPRSSRDQVLGIEHGELKIKLNAPPVDGAANEALLEFLAECLKKSSGSLYLASGQKSRHKRVKISGMKGVEVLKKLDQFIKGR